MSNFTPEEQEVSEICRQAGRMSIAFESAAEASPDPVFGVLEIVLAIVRQRPALLEEAILHLFEHNNYYPLVDNSEELVRWIVEGTAGPRDTATEQEDDDFYASF